MGRGVGERRLSVRREKGANSISGDGVKGVGGKFKDGGGRGRRGRMRRWVWGKGYRKRRGRGRKGGRGVR